MKAILAVDNHGGIGKDNGLPWSTISTDLKRFKDLTLNQIVIMGRNTWESKDMPKPLPNRTNLVVTSQDIQLPPGVLKITDIRYFDHFSMGWIIGGAALFNSLLPKITEIHLTRVPNNYHCDTFIDIDTVNNDFEMIHFQKYPDHTYEILKRTF